MLQVAEMEDAERFAANLLASQDLYFFTRWMFLQRNRVHWMRNWHHKVVCDTLMDVFHGRGAELTIINIPPRYSKTQIAVVNFIAWCLGKVPDAEFLYATYSGELSEKFSKEARELVATKQYRQIFPTVKLAKLTDESWSTTLGGQINAMGLAGTATGKGGGKLGRDSFGGAIIIDDPHKVEEARSAQRRENVITWFEGTLKTRRNNPQRTPIILIMQRLNELDLSGWAMKGGTLNPITGFIEGGNCGLTVKHINISALDPVFEEAVWPAMHTTDQLKLMRKTGPYTFAGQYMQSPNPPEGNIFTPDAIEIVDALPAEGIRWLRGWDFAATTPVIGKDPDFTAGLKLGVNGSGRFFIGDLTHMQGRADKVEQALVNTAGRDGKKCRIDLPQDPGQAGKSQVFYFTQKLAGYPVTSSPESGDKVERAIPFSAQVNAGNVTMLKAEWNDRVIDEMRAFPGGAHDDIVDAGSRAFNALTSKGQPIVIPDGLLARA
jgi:predicted phage terminase large subunit-like protein